jgi:tRNA pseudouridine32 synthase / 23S rRNA pseudouridine746 synthase
MAETSAPTYYYRGRCPRSGRQLALPRTTESEAIARTLMAELGDRLPAGKMYGVLLGQQFNGQRIVLKSFSGLWQGQSHWPGWVPPIPGRPLVAELELQTLEQLTAIAQELQAIKANPLHTTYQTQQTAAQQARQQLNAELQERRRDRQQQRSTNPELIPALDRASRADSATKRQLKEHWQSILQPLSLQIDILETRAQQLRDRRRQLSRQLQSQMHQRASLTNFSGASISLQELRPQGLPTGSGECCAPKLLHYAATHQITPIAMAEFWWGPAQGDKQPGQFYPACIERCQPLMGFLLSGLSAQIGDYGEEPLPIIYEDNEILAIDKPAGLLSVPGRYGQDHVEQRLQRDIKLYPVHRLDRDTSGLLLLAKDLDNYRRLAADFAAQKVRKIYHGILAGKLELSAGTIDLPLYGDPLARPRQRVDEQLGKTSRTHFRRLSLDQHSRVEFQPIGGRTHQIRVHAATGLGIPLLGDPLYGHKGITDAARLTPPERMYLHAYQLTFNHPQSGLEIVLASIPPF